VEQEMTYMGEPYYPKWLDNLAEDVTFEAPAMDGSASGRDDVRLIVVRARELYQNQQFRFAEQVGDYGFVEEYTTEVRGARLNVLVVVNFNERGETQRIVVNHRPRSGLLVFSRAMLDAFAGHRLAEHWATTPEVDIAN
jgi:hypothetical protein